MVFSQGKTARAQDFVGRIFHAHQHCLSGHVTHTLCIPKLRSTHSNSCIIFATKQMLICKRQDFCVVPAIKIKTVGVDHAQGPQAKLWNAQGVGYMTGKTMLMSMKNSAHKILGSGCFTLAEYHDSFLTKGSTHLDTLVWQTAQWIRNNQCYRGELTRDEIEAELRKDIIDAFAH